MDLAEIGRNHLREALTGTMHHVDVDEWKDEAGKPVRIYWKPLTGIEQQQIDAMKTSVERHCMILKVRARDAKGKLIFKQVPLESLLNDYDYDVVRLIAFAITADLVDDKEKPLDDEQKQELIEKE